jgi:hypothetical protein
VRILLGRASVRIDIDAGGAIELVDHPPGSRTIDETGERARSGGRRDT